MRPFPRVRVHPVLRGLVIIVGCALVVSGCALPRNLPAQAEPSVYASLDTCGVVPTGELRNRHPALTATPFFGMPISCQVEPVPDRGFISVSEVSVPLPTEVTALGQEGVTDEQQENGAVVHEATRLHPCRSYVIGENGVRLMFEGHASPSAPSTEPTAELCQLLREAAAATLRTFHRPVPTINWPADSLYRKDLCGLVESTGLPMAFGLQANILAQPSHLQCRQQKLNSTDVIRYLTVEATIGTLPPEGPGRSSLTVAGHAAVLTSSQRSGKSVPGVVQCGLNVTFRPNDYWSTLQQRTLSEGLQVTVHAREPFDCQSIVDAATPLVEAVG